MWALSTAYSRNVVVGEVQEVAGVAEEEEGWFAGSRTHLLFTEADHSPSTLRRKQAPHPPKICKLTGVQHVGRDWRGLIHALAA